LYDIGPIKLQRKERQTTLAAYPVVDLANNLLLFLGVPFERWIPPMSSLVLFDRCIVFLSPYSKEGVILVDRAVRRIKTLARLDFHGKMRLLEIDVDVDDSGDGAARGVDMVLWRNGLAIVLLRAVPAIFFWLIQYTRVHRCHGLTAYHVIPIFSRLL
jgi:hypothetical protein